MCYLHNLNLLSTTDKGTAMRHNTKRLDHVFKIRILKTEFKLLTILIETVQCVSLEQHRGSLLSLGIIRFQRKPSGCALSTSSSKDGFPQTSALDLDLYWWKGCRILKNSHAHHRKKGPCSAYEMTLGSHTILQWGQFCVMIHS